MYQSDGRSCTRRRSCALGESTFSRRSLGDPFHFEVDSASPKMRSAARSRDFILSFGPDSLGLARPLSDRIIKMKKKGRERGRERERRVK